MYGVADSVMIEDYENQQKFMDNLRVRFENELIYVRSPRPPTRATAATIIPPYVRLHDRRALED